MIMTIRELRRFTEPGLGRIIVVPSEEYLKGCDAIFTELVKARRELKKILNTGKGRPLPRRRTVKLRIKKARLKREA